MHEPVVARPGAAPARARCPSTSRSLALAEVAEQQHADVVRRRPRREAVPIPPGKSKQIIPVPAPTRALDDLRRRAPRAPRSTSPAVDRARVGHVAVVALADDRDARRRSGPRPEARDRGVVDGADARACRTGRRASPSSPRSSISSLPVSSPIPLTSAVPAGAGSAGGATTVTPVALAALGLRVADADPGDVGDRVARARARAGPTGPAISRQRSAHPARHRRAGDGGLRSGSCSRQAAS